MSTALNYRIRIRNAADSADVVVITSERGGTNPYISGLPQGDGASFDPISGDSIVSTYSVRIADWPIGSAQRALTSQLEDANFRQQLGFRKTYVEYQINGGGYSNVLICGVLSLARLVTAAEWELQVSDPVRAQMLTQLFSPASSVNIMTFLAAWPNRGCLLGGPVMTPPVAGKPGTVLGIQDRGGWQMKVETTGIAGEYILRPVVVYGPPNWNNEKIQNVAEAINNALIPFQANFLNGAQDPWTTILDTQTKYWSWNGVTALIDSGSGFQPWKPIAYDRSIAVDDNGLASVTALLISTRKGDLGIKVKSDGTRTLTNGAIVRVRVLTVLPTDACPIYLEGNPVDVLTTLWTATSIAYDSDPVTGTPALKNAIGTDAYIALQITSPQQLSDLVSTVCRPFGIGIRVNTSGQLQPFQGRVMGNVPPVAVITTADVVSGSTKLPFELDPSQAVQTIVFRQKRFADQRTSPIGHKGSFVDGVVVNDDEVTLINGDASAVPFGQIELSTDGMLHSKAATVAAFATSIAQSIFDRVGHGAIALETTLLRGGAGDSVKLGDEVLVNLPELPNHNYRLGDNNAIAARAMQVVRRTETPHGYDVRFMDSGPNAQPLATVPTVSIAASSDAPRTVALVTITNAAALNALSYGARLQWATNLTGSVPASTQYADVIAWPAGQIPTGPIRLSPAVAGSTIYVQARSEGVAGARPSNYGGTAHLTLSVINDPTSLTATPSGTDASLCALAWATGSGATGDLVDIWLRLSGQTFDKAVKVDTLNPASVAYTLRGLTSTTNYIASVQHRDPTTQNVSNPVDVSFTAGGTARTLSDPFGAVGFAGSVDKVFGIPRSDGIYGIALIATEVPGFVEVAEAVETAIGSGGYGSFVTVATVPSVAGDWTIFTRVAPNDKLRRQLKARHVGDGVTSSAYTAVVTVLPWVPLALPPFTSNGQGTVSIDSNGGWSATADGQVFVQSWRFATSTSAYPTDATAAAGSIVGGRTFSLSGLGSIAFGQTIFITAIPYTGTSATGAALPSIHLRGSYQTYTATKTTTYSRVAWRDMTLLGFTSNANNDIVNVALASGVIRDRFGISVLLPVGVTLISAAFDVEWNTAATQQIGLFALAVLQNGTSVINSGAPTYAAGVQTVTVSLGSTVTTAGAILFQSTWSNALGPSTADAGQAILRDVSITYSQPKPDVNV